MLVNLVLPAVMVDARPARRSGSFQRNATVTELTTPMNLLVRGQGLRQGR